MSQYISPFTSPTKKQADGIFTEYLPPFYHGQPNPEYSLSVLSMWDSVSVQPHLHSILRKIHYQLQRTAKLMMFVAFTEETSYF